MNNNLLEGIVDVFKKYLNGLEAKQKQKRLHFPLSQLNDITHYLFPKIENGGVCSIPVPAKPSWNPENQYFIDQREASIKGVHIERALLLPLKHLVNDPIVQRQIELDIEAGIKIRLLYIGNLLKECRLPLLDSLEFSVWDNKILISKFYSEENHTPLELIISSNIEDLEVATFNWNLIVTEAIEISPSTDNESSLDLEEPMLTTAPVVDFLSKVLCKGNHVNSKNCRWYHSVWQYFRILDLVSTPTWHADFYFEQIYKSINKNKLTTILISGTADYSMLAHVFWATKDIPSDKIKIVVLDLCETPLFLCKWYASSINRNVETISQDIFKYNPKYLFDIIVTDAFLTRFSFEQRKSILEKWYSLLLVGGTVITTVRMGGTSSGIARRGSQYQTEQFVKNIRATGRQWKDFLPIALEELEKHGKYYAENMISYSAGNKKDIINLFEETKFSIYYSKENEVKGELQPTTYLDVVARKVN
jgi:hypothetical protein